jgi:hypothetical protein
MSQISDGSGQQSKLHDPFTRSSALATTGFPRGTPNLR